MLVVVWMDAVVFSSNTVVLWLFLLPFVSCYIFVCANCLFGFIVDGNAGPEIDRKVRVDLVNLRTIHMEYDPCSVSGYTVYNYFCWFYVVKLV